MQCTYRPFMFSMDTPIHTHTHTHTRIKSHLFTHTHTHTQGMQSHERFFFLFDDLLIIAKPFRKQK